MVRQGLLPGARRAEERDRGGDQEGVPQARPGAPSRTRTAATRRPRSGSRRSPPRTTCWATPRSGRTTTRSATWSRPASDGAARARRGAGGPRVRRRGPGASGSGSKASRRASSGDIGDLSDLFGGLFGGRGAAGAGRRREPARGADLQTEVTLSFEEAMQGTTVPIQIKGPAPCPVCGGSGAEPGTSPIVCPECGGTGQRRREPGHVLRVARPARGAPAAASVIEHPCHECHGTGTRAADAAVLGADPRGRSRRASASRSRAAARAASRVRRPATCTSWSTFDPHPRVRPEGRGPHDRRCPVTYPELALGCAGRGARP